MGWLKRIFGGKQDQGYVDKHGLYFYVQCDNCNSKVRVRADKQHDLNRDGGGFTWHKTIVDSRCFRQIPVVVHMDGSYQVTSQEIEGGRFYHQGSIRDGRVGRRDTKRRVMCASLPTKTLITETLRVEH